MSGQAHDPRVPLRLELKNVLRDKLQVTRAHLSPQATPPSGHTTSMACARNGMLMTAIEAHSFGEVVQVLGKSPSAQFVNNPCGALKVTALQLAASKGEEGIGMVELLLAKGARVGVSDILGRTPLHYAAASGSQHLVDVLLSAGAAVDSRFQVTSPSPQAADKTSSSDKRNDDDETDGFFGKPVFECRDVTVGAQLPVPECLGRTPLHQAVKGGHPAVVRRLLQAGATVDASDDKGLTPLLLAGAGIGPDDDPALITSYEEIVALLVSAGANPNLKNSDTGTTALTHAVALQSVRAARCLLDAGADVAANELLCGETMLHEAAKQGNIRVVDMLFEYGGVESMVNAQDQVGRTPLHLAAYVGERDVLTLLINHGGDLSIMTSTGVSVMDAIFSHIPRPINFLTDSLDSCVVPNAASVNDRTFKVHLNFSVLSPQGAHHQMAVVSSLMQGASYYQMMLLLQHPVLESYLRLKWIKLRIFFLALLFVHIVFVLSLSAYVFLLTDERRRMEQQNILAYSRRILFASASILFLNGFAQLVMLPRHYARQLETWLSLVCACMCLAVSVHGEVEHMLRNSQEVHKWVFYIMSVAVLLAWAELMLLIGRFPTWGLYALMFYTVLRNVFRVLLTFVCLVIGFAFSFSIQFHSVPAFSDPWKSFVKTTVMMMGEFEYDNMFNDSFDVAKSDVNSGNVDNADISRWQTAASRFIFLLFILLTTIVLMNLLVGLAVSDIQALEQESHVRRRLKQADFVAHLEKFTSHNLMRVYFPARVTHWLDRRRSIDVSLHLQPSDNSTWRKRVNPDLLDSLVVVAIKNQGLTSRGHGGHAHERKGASRLHSIREDLPGDQRTTLSVLDALRRDINDIREMLDADRNTSQVTRRNADKMAASSYDERKRPVGKRFSDVVVMGMKGQQEMLLRRMKSIRTVNDRVNHIT